MGNSSGFGGSSTSLTDCLTALKNLVTATNNAARQALAIAGSQVIESIGAATLVSSGPGRVVNVSVTTTGAIGTLYDSPSAGVLTHPLYVIPAAVGVYAVNMPYGLGLVVAPGAAQVVAVSYSPGAATGAQ